MKNQGCFHSGKLPWDVASGKGIATLKETEPVWSVAFSLNGKTLASGSGDKIKLWDLPAAKQADQ